ncbi:MAG: hypothetical protein ABWY19_16345 [Marmoricola sp.]
MRHRSERSATSKVVGGVADRLIKLTDLLADEPETKRSTITEPRIPTQLVPTHDGVETVEPEALEVEVAQAVEAQPVEVKPVEVEVATDEAEEAPEPAELAAQVSPVLSRANFPARAHWKASHGPRVFAAAMLLFAVAGTSALALRYAETRGSEEFVSLVVGVGVVVALWALLIASTPQVVSLRGSLLTVRNSSGSECFDLADGRQSVDVVGEPRSSQWALLLHRPNNTSVVLRRRDVDAVALDPIVRHYRALADQRYADRQVRFSR